MTAQKRGYPKSRARRKPLPARELALQILVTTESRSAYSDRLLETRLREAALPPEEAHLVTALVQGSLRQRGTLDHHLATFARENWNGLPAWIKAALRLGAYQLLFMDRIPASAAVDESVELAKKYGHPGTAGLANAILRRLARGERAPLPDPDASPVEYLSASRSHPRWIVERWVARYGRDEAGRMLEANNEEPSVTVRPSLARASEDEILDRLRSEGFEPEPAPNGGLVWIMRGGFVPSRSPAFREGLISLQDEAEAAVVPILAPKPGETILDLCAAPGGKSAQIAEAVGSAGRLFALERHPSRARALRENMSGRLRAGRVHVICGDGLSPPFRAAFDRVLVDAPCSGLGVLRRRADARWRKEESGIAAMAALQPRLLDAAAALVRRGGVLVYSVCSLEPEETHDVVELFLRAHPDFVQENVDPYLPPGFRSGAPHLSATPQRHGTDGVFAARVRRR
ncbi:MAG: 16S rRNA (cytosine(967)-C(5))-methyltransferase RsmB [Candidatus Eisenbacteria bacterium]|uniref:16S rRNA (cytosine(967)-C(5))-methyltransferase n=1 Tax=Eiseniibacteriota bacterium TaxID=2212470 RepID=A0A538TPX9_UNCEI|nr:MAG: 16S rRNA (cytosine(967)-C(5))-methyltransferase RsmB [Candidatus Eisenbacteria bacterium]